MRVSGACAIVVTLALVIALRAPSSLSAQTLTTYDDFASEQLDPERWAGMRYVVAHGSVEGGWLNGPQSQWAHHPEFSVVNTLVDRRVVGGQLRLHLGTSGGTHDNTMAPGHGRLAARGRAGAVTRVQSRVTVIAADAQPCRSTGESRTRAQVHLELLRDTADDTLLFATLSLQRSTFGGDRIVAVLSRCRDSSCTVAEDLDWIVFNRPWTLGHPHTLTVTHQPANDRVVFAVSGGGLAAESQILRYTPPPSEHWLSGPFSLRVENSPSNCPAADAAPSERVAVTMDARFDNVRTSELNP